MPSFASARANAQPQAERAVLVEFFNATNGPAWTNNTGWNTDSPVCEWIGVWCAYPDGNESRPAVTHISLAGNNLVGYLPATLSSLAHLQLLDVARNRLEGTFPEDLLVKWDNHKIELRWWGNKFRQLLTRIQVEYRSGGVLCSLTEDVNYSVDIVDSKASLKTVRCADARNGDRSFCSLRTGRVLGLDRLSRALTSLRVGEFQSDYRLPEFTLTTHQTTVKTTWTWGDGSAKAVTTYGEQGPLNVWMAQQLTLGMVADIGWTETGKQPRCDFGQ